MSADGLGLSTVVIDAGHGGKDAGCVSADKRTYEKTLTLDIAKNLASKINEEFPEVRVVLTRSRDEYVTLDERAKKANDAKADLFISIHINAIERGSGPNGFSVHVLGQSPDKNKDLFASNMDVCRRENAVMMLEDDYETKYQGFNPADPESYIFMLLMQNSHLEQSLSLANIIERNLKGGPIKKDRGIWQDPFYVLWAVGMPSVLVELGFISNPGDLSALRQKANREQLAERLFKAFREYKTAYDASIGGVSAGQVGTPKPAAVYGVQIFAGSRLLDASSPEFLGYEPRIIRSGNIYKYCISVSDTEAGAREDLASIRRKYPDAFLVRIEGQAVTAVR